MKKIIFFEYSQHPPFWIAQDEDGYWLVPAKNQGWEDRTPFIGRVGYLKEITEFGNVDLGIPQQ